MEHPAPSKPEDVRGVGFLGRVAAFDEDALAYHFDVIKPLAGDVGATYVVKSAWCTPEYRFSVGDRYIFSWAGVRYDESLKARLEQPSSWDSAAWQVRDDGGVALHPLGNMGGDLPAFRKASTIHEVLALVAPATLPDTSVRSEAQLTDGRWTAMLVATAAAVAAWLFQHRRRWISLH